MYETAEAGRRFMPLIPIVARIDGRNFSIFTKGMDRPYDKNMADMMVETTKFLVDRFDALVGYTQSDEITLVWFIDSTSKSEYVFDGRLQKFESLLASACTGFSKGGL
jgi:tRNA(His) 5'-end guanylyltransferase